jgi:ribosomal protein S18 acetylase RimI-like enzyme
VTVEVERVVVADAPVVSAVRRLLPQLSDRPSEVEANDVETVVNAQATTLFVARDDTGGIVGMLTLATFRLPSGVRAWIEDVVVDEDARRLGAGRALVEAAVEVAREAGAASVDLTSRPSRESARRLYETMGFEERSTTAFRKPLR